MTQPDLQLEQEELLQRAAELEIPLDPWPTVDPIAPCDLDFVNKASDDLALSADNIGVYLDVGNKSRKDLAQALTNAAKAYENVDESSAESMLNTMGGGSGSGTGNADENDEPSCGPLGAWYNPADWGKSTHKSKLKEPDKNPDDYADLQTRAHEIEQPDQGIAFTNFANAWSAYQRMLLGVADALTGSYRPFQKWTGAARESVEQNFRDMRKWTLDAAEKCDTIATQASIIVSAHKVAVKEHPTSAQLAALDKQYNSGNIADRILAMNQYEEYQKQSDAAIDKYKQSITGGVQTLGEPPSAVVIDPPEPTPTPGPTPPTPFDPIIDDFTQPDTPITPGQGMSDAEEPGDGEFNDEFADGTVISTGSGMRPASFGGDGLSKAPLKPAAGGEAMSRVISGREAAGVGARASGAGGAMGGAGMGGAPVGAAGGTGQDGKTKHADDEEMLYTEERSWTEGLIGAHKRKDATEMMAERND